MTDNLGTGAIVDEVLAEAPPGTTHRDHADRPTDPLAKDLIALFVEAASNKIEVTRRMQEAYWAAQGVYSPDARCKLEDPNEIYVGVFAQQLSTYMAWVLDRISQTKSFFTLEPTPIPRVPDRFRALALERVMRELRELDYLPTEQAIQYARGRIADLKVAINQTLYDEARRAVAGMERAMNDIMVDGGFLQAYIEFHRDVFCSLGVMKFPAVVFEKQIDWTAGGKPHVVERQVMRWARVSPMDFYWSPDSTNAQDGRYVCEHTRLPVEALEWLARNAPDGVVRAAVDYLIAHCPEGTPWVSGVLQEESERAMRKETMQATVTAHVPGTYDCLIVHTKLRGDVLISYGIREFKVAGVTQTVRPESYYETECWVVENLTCYIAINAHPLGRRPYWVASYEPVNGQLMGTSAWDKVRSIEIAYRNTHRHLLRYVAFESSFIAEVDAGRFVSADPPTEISPWGMFTVDADYTGGGRPAMYFHNNARGNAEIRAYLSHLEQLAQHATGIYNTMAGSTAYGTIARTRFGVESVQSNATKIVFAKAEYIDKYAMEPMFRALYDYLMLYGEDDSIKVDAQVVVRGITSVGTREAQVQRAIQLLQYLPAMLQLDQQSGSASIPPAVVQNALRRVVEGLGGDTRSMPDPEAVNSVAQAIGLSPPGDFEATRAQLAAEMPSERIQVPPA